jgi:hypothetical protein
MSKTKKPLTIPEAIEKFNSVTKLIIERNFNCGVLIRDGVITFTSVTDCDNLIALTEDFDFNFANGERFAQMKINYEA